MAGAYLYKEAEEKYKNLEDIFDTLILRDIWLSERTFYRKITDIYATAIDYDQSATATKRFFATVQYKFHWVIHGQTASEIICARADAEKSIWV